MCMAWKECHARNSHLMMSCSCRKGWRRNQMEAANGWWVNRSALMFFVVGWPTYAGTGRLRCRGGSRQVYQPSLVHLSYIQADACFCQRQPHSSLAAMGYRLLSCLCFDEVHTTETSVTLMQPKMVVPGCSLWRFDEAKSAKLTTIERRSI